MSSQLLHQFLVALTQGQLQFSEQIAAPSQAEQLARLAIYQTDYQNRLAAALSSNLPLLANSASQELWQEMCHKFIAACPSTKFSLQTFGMSMPGFLMTNLGFNPHLVEVAALDVALLIATIAPDETIISHSHLHQAGEAWLNWQLGLTQSATLLEFTTNIIELWHGQELSLAKLQSRKPPTQVLVWRNGLTNHYREISQQEHALLQMLAQTSTWLALCEELATRKLANPVQVGLNYLGQWLVDGLIIDSATR